MSWTSDADPQWMINLRIAAIRGAMDAVADREPDADPKDSGPAWIVAALSFAALKLMEAGAAPISDAELSEVTKRMRDAAIRAMANELDAVIAERN